MVLFDLGRTLEDGGALRPGAREALQGIADLDAGGCRPVLMALLSDVEMPDDPAEVPAVRERYVALLDDLGIRRFFEPVDRRVTLSAEVGTRKPAPAMFRAAVAKAEPALTFDDVLFATEDGGHVVAARSLGLRAVRVSAPGRSDGEVAELTDLLPIVQDLVGGTGSGPRGQRAAGVRTVLGDEEVVIGGRAPVPSPPGGPPARAARRHAAPTAERLHLVTQNGRLFQDEHPGIDVLVDLGRNLVVELDPQAAQELAGAGGACWSVRPLPTDAVVLRAGTVAGQRRAAPPAWVQECVDGLSPETFAADVATLAAHRTRHSASAGFDAAADWAAEQLAAAGCVVSTQAVPDGGPACRNVIGERSGGGPGPREVVLVAAHLDSVNRRGPSEPAPGADDNASGSAGVLAVAGALAGLRPVSDLRMVLFGGEEQGLLGSRRYVAGLSGDERGRIRAVVTMDMIGTRNTATPGVLLEGAAVSAHVLDALADAAAAHTGLAVTVSHSPANSDHVPFIDQGIPAVLTIEAADSANPRIHTAQDTTAFVDSGLALDILRMNVAFVAGLLGRAT